MCNNCCSNTVPVFHLPMSRPNFQNSELFRIQWHDTGSYNLCNNTRYIDIWNNAFNNNGCGCNNFFGYNYGYPLLGSGSTNGNGTATAWSRKGYANANQYGSTIINNNPRKGSKNYNLGAFGSYASGGGNKAWNILGGLLSYASSGGNKSVDASNLANTVLGSLVETGMKYWG